VNGPRNPAQAHRRGDEAEHFLIRLAEIRVAFKDSKFK
jgi:hypothetical protein